MARVKDTLSHIEELIEAGCSIEDLIEAGYPAAYIRGYIEGMLLREGIYEGS